MERSHTSILQILLVLALISPSELRQGLIDERQASVLLQAVAHKAAHEGVEASTWLQAHRQVLVGLGFCQTKRKVGSRAMQS